MSSRRIGKWTTHYKPWECTSCGESQAHGDRHCMYCGNPKEEDELKGSKSNLRNGVMDTSNQVTDPNELRVTARGADWFCVYCSGGNLNNHPDHGRITHCENCGGVRNEKAPKQKAAPRRRTRAPRRNSPPPPPPKYTNDGYLYESSDDPAPASSFDWQKVGLVAAAVMSAVLVIGLLVWGFSSHPVDGKVTGKSMTASVQQYDWKKTRDADWRSDISKRAHRDPTDGKNSGEVSGCEFSEYSDCRMKEDMSRSYDCNPHNECVAQPDKAVTKSETVYGCEDNYDGTESCGNTLRTWTEYEPQPCVNEIVYDTCYEERKWCEYDTWKWKRGKVYSNTVVNSDDRQAALPSYSNTKAQYTTPATYGYQVDIKYTDGNETDTWNYTPSKYKEYTRYTKGQDVPLLVNNFGGVSLNKEAN